MTQNQNDKEAFLKAFLKSTNENTLEDKNETIVTDDDDTIDNQKPKSFVDTLKEKYEKNPSLFLIVVGFIFIFLALTFSLGVFALTQNSEKISENNQNMYASPSPISENNDQEKDSSPSPSPSMTPSTSPKPSTSPTPSPTTNPVAELVIANAQISIKKIIEDNVQTAPEGSVVSSGNNTTFYYKHEKISKTEDLSEFLKNATVAQGNLLNSLVIVKNNGNKKSEPQTLKAEIKYDEGGVFEKTFNVPALESGEQSNIYSFSVEEATSKLSAGKRKGKVSVNWTMDSSKNLSFNYTIEPDKKGPFLQLYANSLSLKTTMDRQVCFNAQQIFTRDDLDAIYDDGPSQETDLRYKTSVDQNFTNWFAYKELYNTAKGEQCVPAQSGTQYYITYESKDKTGNVTSVTKYLKVE